MQGSHTALKVFEILEIISHFSRTWKVLENRVGPWKFWNLKVLESEYFVIIVSTCKFCSHFLSPQLTAVSIAVVCQLTALLVMMSVWCATVPGGPGDPDRTSSTMTTSKVTESRKWLCRISFVSPLTVSVIFHTLALRAAQNIGPLLGLPRHHRSPP